MNMESSEDDPLPNKIAIQKALLSIKDITLKIKTELDILNDIAKSDGQLHNVLINAIATLTPVAENMGIDVENVLSNKEQHELQDNLRNDVSAAAFQQKILACLNKT